MTTTSSAPPAQMTSMPQGSSASSMTSAPLHPCAMCCRDLTGSWTWKINTLITDSKCTREFVCRPHFMPPTLYMKLHAERSNNRSETHTMPNTTQHAIPHQAGGVWWLVCRLPHTHTHTRNNATCERVTLLKNRDTYLNIFLKYEIFTYIYRYSLYVHANMLENTFYFRIYNIHENVAQSKG